MVILPIDGATGLLYRFSYTVVTNIVEEALLSLPGKNGFISWQWLPFGILASSLNFRWNCVHIDLFQRHTEHWYLNMVWFFAIWSNDLQTSFWHHPLVSSIYLKGSFPVRYRTTDFTKRCLCHYVLIQSSYWLVWWCSGCIGMGLISTF